MFQAKSMINSHRKWHGKGGTKFSWESGNLGGKLGKEVGKLSGSWEEGNEVETRGKVWSLGDKL